MSDVTVNTSGSVAADVSNVSDSVKAKLQSQIEFYFSDSNFKDRWLREKLLKDEQGFLPLVELLAFNRVKQICADLNVVKEVCANSEVLTLDDSGTKVKRSTPWPLEDTSEPRTVFARNVDPDANLDMMLEFFGRWGRVNAVRVRRNKAKTARLDSVWVEYSNVHAANQFVGAAPNERLLNGRSVHGQPKAEFVAELNARKAQKQQQQQQQNSDSKKRKIDDNTADSSSKSAKPEVEFTPGLIVHFSGIGKSLRRQALKEAWKAYGNIKFIEYQAGKSEGFLRLDTDGAAFIAAANAEGAEVDGGKPVFRVLEGEEEKAYWSRITTARHNKKK